MSNKSKTSERKKRYYQKNKEKTLQRVSNRNKEKRLEILAYAKKRYSNPEIKEKIREYKKKYQKESYAKICAYKKKNRAKINQTMRLYRANRIKIDPQYRLSINLRNRLLRRLKTASIKKQGSHIADLGCSIAELKQHLEPKSAICDPCFLILAALS